MVNASHHSIASKRYDNKYEGIVTTPSKYHFDIESRNPRWFSFIIVSLVFGSSICLRNSEAFFLTGSRFNHRYQSRSSTGVARLVTSSMSSVDSTKIFKSANAIEQYRDLTPQIISAMSYRDLKNELASRGQPSEGTKSQLRKQLRQLAIPDYCDVDMMDDEGDCITKEMSEIMEFTAYGDSFKDALDEIEVKVTQGHWKAATRKLKKLTRREGDRVIPEETYLQVLEVCMDKRLQGARASESARKILDQLVEQGYGISEDIGNFCIDNCLQGTGHSSTHQGFGGIDTALAIKAAMDAAGSHVHLGTIENLIAALAKEGSISLAIDFLQYAVVARGEKPSLASFAVIAQTAASSNIETDIEKVFDVLSYAKVSGYSVESIVSLEEGRVLLVSGVIAAEKLKQDALGFRLLTAAGNANNTSTMHDRGDIMIASASPAAQRACAIIHKRAINKAAEDGEWKLAVKLLDLMLQRRLRPSNLTWKNVVTCCAKQERSRKTTALLLDWVKLSEKREAEKPPLSVFNTVINACETCNEQELTLLVLDSMKKTWETDGNLITFNIALKRLAKLGSYQACEAIIVGMLKSNVEPSVVTYTTAIAACVFKDNKQPTVAYEWLRRMRVRNVAPNIITYNTALASCLDGKFASTALASKIATEMLVDVDTQLQEFDDDLDIYRNVIPNDQTKELARKLMQQLKNNWENGEIEKSLARETLRVPLLKLVDFQKSEAAEKARIQAAARKLDDKKLASIIATDVELEALAFHRSAEV